ncbi:MAG: 4'-phosphopantetheinyl transferase superfamily protein [Mycoplasmataceae bacterium]|nr:4'-phosphopantetheinyl transferase superfamily protein [Mycoplasmataceae bacterium]
MNGIDITNIKRFENPKDAFLKKVLHVDEISEYNEATNKSVFLAKRWAIKEALFKADNELFHFNKIKVFKENGKYKYQGYIISTSIEDNYCIALAYKEK